MLFNDMGEYFGLLSGGCLESYLHKKAMLALHEKVAINVECDSTEEDSEAYQLGLGCGGIVHIVLQPMLEQNNYLNLSQLLQLLDDNQSVKYSQYIPNAKGSSQAKIIQQNSFDQQIHYDTQQHKQWFSHHIKPMPKLLIFGGGVDARSLATMSVMMGMQVIVCDPRSANAQYKDFSMVSSIERCDPKDISEQSRYLLSAVVIMMHNKELDASVLQTIKDWQLDYCALLGPIHRKDEVLNYAGLDEASLGFNLSSPAGLDVGAKLPEEIAISILSEYLQQR